MPQSYWRSFLLLILTAAAAPVLASDVPRFAEVIVDAGYNVVGRPLVARLDDSDDIHLIVIGEDDEFERRILVFAVSNADAPSTRLVADLQPDRSQLAFDIGNIDGQDMLMLLRPGEILRYDLDTQSLEKWRDGESYFRQERDGAISKLDFLEDVNDDGRDDILLPDFDGYRVRLQQADGSFGEESVLNKSVQMSLSGRDVQFSARSLYSGDMNFDGLTDLFYWSGDDIGFYAQKAGLQFAVEPVEGPSGLGVLSQEEIQRLEDNRGSIDQEGLTERDIESIVDLNGDDIPDIIAEAAYSEGLFDRSNEFSLHLGRAGGDQVEFLPEEDASIASEGLQFDLIETDINGDGKQDLVVRKAKLSFGRVIRALIAGSLSVEIHFHKMTEDDRYEDEANFVAKTKVRFSRSSGQVDIPALEVADFDGDGLQDLVVQTESDRLSYYRGESTNRLFAKKPSEFEVVLPRNGELVDTEDINGDGRADMLLRYDESDADGLEKTVRLLLSVPAE